MERVQGGGFGHRSSFFDCRSHSVGRLQKTRLRDKSLPQRLKPSLIRNRFRGPEGPLFHGAVCIHGAACIHHASTVLHACASFSAGCEVVSFPKTEVKGPLFHGAVCIHGAARMRSLVLQLSEIHMSAELNVYVASIVRLTCASFSAGCVVVSFPKTEVKSSFSRSL